jgi:WD40 repeat protein
MRLIELVIFIFVVGVYASTAQEVSIESSSYGYPFLSAEIELIDDSGNSVAPDLQAILIRQGNNIIEPARIFQVSNRYRVDWVPHIQGLSQADETILYEYELIYSGFDEIISDEGFIIDTRLPLMSIQDTDNRQIDEILFPFTLNTFNRTIQFYLRLNKGPYNPDINQNVGVQLDSITYDSTAFRVFPSITLPSDLGQSGQYLFNIVFSPPTFEYYSTVVTFHFNGGYTQSIDVAGNIFPLERNFDIELRTPADDEVIAPCTEYPISWKGASDRIPSIVEVSFDAGRNFERIISTFDSVFVWNVPDTLSEFVVFRVRQISATEEFGQRILQVSSPRKVAISPTGIYSAIAIEGSGLFGYNNNSEILRAISKISTPFNKENTDLQFASENIVVESFYRERFGMRFDTLDIYDVASSQHIESYLSPVAVRKLKPYKGETLLLSPELANRVYTFDHTDGSFDLILQVNYPIADVSYSEQENVLAVTSISGKVELYNANTLVLVDDYQIQNFPQTSDAVISPDGELLAVSKFFTDGTVQNIVIHDLVNKRRHLRVPQAWASETVGVEFAPNSRQLLMAHSFIPKLAVTDLTSNDLTQTITTEAGSDRVLDFNYATADNEFVVLQDELLSRFSYDFPQYDINDGYVKIRNPEIEIDPIVLISTLVADTSIVIANSQVCNTSEAPFPIRSVWLKSGRDMTIISPLDGFLPPAECATLEFEFHPTTIGEIRDTAYITSCVDTLIIPIEGISLERSVLLAGEPFDFGEQCLGDRIEITEEFFTNLDTADIKINRVSFARGHFNAVLSRDTVIRAGESWSATIFLNPTERGQQTDTLLLYNSDMREGPPLMFEFTYFGLGSDINQEHTYLPFTPEQPERRTFIVNREQTPIQVNDVFLDNGTHYSLSASLPTTLQFGDTLFIDVVSTDPSRTDFIGVSAEPCINFERITVGPYIATAQIIAFDTETRPTDYATIIIGQRTQTQNYFKGDLKLDLEIRIDAETFLPLEYESDFEIISTNDIVDGTERAMQISLQGDFREFDTVLRITGPAALTEITEAEIIPTDLMGNFSSTVPTTFENGVLRIINDSPGRLIFAEGQDITVDLYPNPSSEYINIRLKTEDDVDELQSRVGIYSSTGQQLEQKNIGFTFEGGESIHKLNISTLRKGEYFIDVELKEGLSHTVKFVIE